MSCERIEYLVSEAIDGEILPDDARLLETHLAECASCRLLADACRDQDREIREAFSGRIRDANELAERFAGAFRRRRSEPRSFARVAKIAAAVAIGFGLGWWTFLATGTGPPGLGSGLASDSSPPPARLAFATGRVEIREPERGDWRPLASQDPIAARASVRCAPDALCELHAADGSIVRLGSSGELTMSGARQWQLERGRLWTQVARRDASFEVRFGEAVVTALGTRFEVDHDGGLSVVRVFSGSTKIALRDRVHVVRRGEEAEIAGDVTIRSLGESVIRATSWMNALLVVEGRKDTELARRLEELLARVGQQKMSVLYEDEIRALGSSCVAPLTEYIASPRSLEDRDKRLRAARIVADLATPESIDRLIELLPDPDAEVRAEIARALARLTGDDLGLSPDEWRQRSWRDCEPTFLRWLDWRAKKGGKS
jgi:ferric-dicitrate binding protein FerR (iron transport regulator)